MSAIQFYRKGANDDNISIETMPKNNQANSGQLNLKELIEFFPETIRINEITDVFFQKMHKDENLKEFSKFFSQIVQDNSVSFKTIKLEDKAKMLFEVYKEMAFEKIRKIPEFSIIFSELEAKVGKELPLLPIISNEVNKTITRLHRGLPSLAISQSLQVSVVEINISEQLSDVSKLIISDLTISECARKLFQALM